MVWARRHAALAWALMCLGGCKISERRDVILLSKTALIDGVPTG